MELAGKVVSGSPEVAESHRSVVKHVDRRERRTHRAITGCAVFRRKTGQGIVVDDTALQPLHEIERRANNLSIVAIAEGPRRRDRALLKRPKHAIFAVDRVSRWHQ